VVCAKAFAEFANQDGTVVGNDRLVFSYCVLCRKKSVGKTHHNL
jgi:hypothetical protein